MANTRILAGDIKELVLEHTIATMSLKIKSDTDNNIQIGGYVSADDENNVSTSGEVLIDARHWVTGVLSCTILTDNRQNELGTLQAIQSSEDDATFTMTHTSGVVYSGVGMIVGNIELQGNSGSIDLTIRVPKWDILS